MVTLCDFVSSQETFPVLAVLLKPITEEFGWSRTSFVLPMVIGTILGGFLGLFVGPRVDRYGPRWVAVIAFTVLGGLLVAMGWIATLWHFYGIQIAARTITHGIIGLAMMVVVPKWFVAQRGRAVALTSMGHRLGQLVLPPLTLLLVSLGGWRTATVAQGLMVWGIAIVPAGLFLRRQPEDMGLLPDGVTPEQLEGRGDSTEDRAAAAARERIEAEVSLSAREVVRLPAFYLLTLANMLNPFAAAGLNLHLFPYLTDQGIPEVIAVAAVTTWFFVGVPGTLIAGFLAERFSSRTVAIVGFALMAAPVFLLPWVRSAPLAFVFAVTHGLGQGTMVVLRMLWPDYFGRRNLGAIRGLTHPAQNLAIAGGPLVGALIFDVTGGYTLAFLTYAVGLLGAAVCIFFARPPRRQERAEVIPAVGSP